MPRVALDRAYPGISFRPKSRNWLAWLMHLPAECVHLETDQSWMATFIPDTLYLRGKAAPRKEEVRPEASLCRACLTGLLEPELVNHHGRVVAFEPDRETFSQYFFLDQNDFQPAGLTPNTSMAIEKRLQAMDGPCDTCGAPATWLWISHREVGSLDQTDRIEECPGALYCAEHGAARLCAALHDIEEANLFYVNVPYGDRGAYVWI